MNHFPESLDSHAETYQCFATMIGALYASCELRLAYLATIG